MNQMKPARFSRRNTWGRYLIVALCLLSAGSVYAGGATQLAKARASYQKKQAAIEKKFLVDKSASIAKQYTKLLSEVVDTYRAEGKLDEFLTAKEELARFQTARTVEESDLLKEPEFVRNAQQQFIRITQANQQKMLKQQAKLAKAYIQHLRRLQKKLTQKYLTDQALLVKGEIAAVQASVDFDVLTPAKKPQKTKAAPPTRSVTIPIVRKRVAPDRLAVYLQGPKGPLQGVKVELKAQGPQKAQSRRSDRQGCVEFITKADMEYTISVINTHYEPFVQQISLSGESYEANLIPLPKGVKILETTGFAEFKLPGFSSMRFYGSYAATGVPVSAVRLKPSSPKTKLPDCLPDPHGFRVNVDTWLPVTEGFSRVEMKVLAPNASSRMILYRKCSDTDSDKGFHRTTGPDTSPLAPKERLIVHATDKKTPVSGIQIECKPYADGNIMVKSTDQKGQALFKVDPEAEYGIRIFNKAYMPIILPHGVGGESYAAELIPMPNEIKLIRMTRAGDFKLPGITSIQIFGFTGNSDSISQIHMRTGSPRTTFSVTSPHADRFLIDVDAWVTVTERSRSVEMKILAPDADTRVILYRKLS